LWFTVYISQGHAVRKHGWIFIWSAPTISRTPWWVMFTAGYIPVPLSCVAHMYKVLRGIAPPRYLGPFVHVQLIFPRALYGQQASVVGPIWWSRPSSVPRSLHGLTFLLLVSGSQSSINQSINFLHSQCKDHWLGDVSKLHQNMTACRNKKNVLTVDEKLTVNLQRRRQLAVCCMHISGAAAAKARLLIARRSCNGAVTTRRGVHLDDDDLNYWL